MIFPLAEAKTTDNKATKFQKITEAQDAQIELKTQGHIDRDIFNADPWLMAILVALRENPVAMQQVMQAEMNQLTTIMNDPDTPLLTKQILAEVLANEFPRLR